MLDDPSSILLRHDIFKISSSFDKRCSRRADARLGIAKEVTDDERDCEMPNAESDENLDQSPKHETEDKLSCGSDIIKLQP
ncbi:hypothetical protein N7520_011413 [Penicillium odoratum]|uniref:uncharacterized protein n=1 Tax=Penicillium odoratum TaxID=1167516 RepID=UPI0025495BCA|nr:uncharacterized protein N7520_011413 [Penicillium odoratum]KAJ5746231.1 hypothetical protein N7520_011413 [Penicillium odoratum]